MSVIQYNRCYMSYKLYGIMYAEKGNFYGKIQKCYQFMIKKYDNLLYE